jgi:hypothetical protein
MSVRCIEKVNCSLSLVLAHFWKLCLYCRKSWGRRIASFSSTRPSWKKHSRNSQMLVTSRLELGQLLTFLPLCPKETLFFSSFFFLVVLGFELKALHLLGSHSITWTMLPSLKKPFSVLICFAGGPRTGAGTQRCTVGPLYEKRGRWGNLEVGFFPLTLQSREGDSVSHPELNQGHWPVCSEAIQWGA